VWVEIDPRFGVARPASQTIPFLLARIPEKNGVLLESLKISPNLQPTHKLHGPTVHIRVTTFAQGCITNRKLGAGGALTIYHPPTS
jgi:hypothetical protein